MLPIVDIDKCKILGKELDDKKQICAGGQTGQVRKKIKLKALLKAFSTFRTCALVTGKFYCANSEV